MLAHVFTLSAGLGGMLLVPSGFRDDSSSYQMSTGFIIALVFTFLSRHVVEGQEVSAPVVARTSKSS